ncbi:MAG TPA: hypothetical protein VJ728_04870, partial [Candidatus Binataceae bacterium]|nr:hypothetical protein [Candidatus Binataceae bacterium]
QERRRAIARHGVISTGAESPESLVDPSWRLRHRHFPTTPATAPMCIDKRTYVKNWAGMTPKNQHQVTVLKGGRPTQIKTERVREIMKRWRIGARQTRSTDGSSSTCRTATTTARSTVWTSGRRQPVRLID